MNQEILQAVSSFISLVSKGWDTETACLCVHDTIYDEIELNEFITLCQKEVKNIHQTIAN